MKSAFLIAACCFLLLGCAAKPNGRTANILSETTDLRSAEAIFGPPTATSSLDGGRTRAVWSFSRVFQVPARSEERDIVVGTDHDGFAVVRTVSVYTPPHGELQNCRIDIVAEADGRVVNTSMSGNSCDMLLTPKGREFLHSSQ